AADGGQSGGASGSASRSGGHVDEQQRPILDLEHRQEGMPEVLADAQPNLVERIPDLGGTDLMPGAGKSALIEESVGGQVHLPVETDESAPAQQGDAVAIPP